MSQQQKGKVTFVNHEKQYVNIEYIPTGKGKAKTVNGNVDETTQLQWKEKGLIKAIHNFSVNDIVTFDIVLSQRGDKNIATHINFSHNENLDVLLQQAKQGMMHKGYIKQVDSQFFVKEIDSYLFFKLEVSPWQKPFTEADYERVQNFTLTKLERKEKALAVLERNYYIPDYNTVLKIYNTTKTANATVVKITDFGVYVAIANTSIVAKLPDDGKLRLNQEVEVKINFFSPQKIAVELVV